jgi:hypothetical protein
LHIAPLSRSTSESILPQNQKSIANKDCSLEEANIVEIDTNCDGKVEHGIDAHKPAVQDASWVAFVDRTSARDPDFIGNYLGKSRLHYLSTWGLLMVFM